MSTTRTHAHARTQTKGTSAYGLAPRARCARNSQRLPREHISPSFPSSISMLHHVAKSHIRCKKVAKSFGGSDFFCNFAAMEQRQYIITGINRLTKEREQISRPMSIEEAQERLSREMENRKHQKYAAHTRLQIEPLVAVQLTIQFKDYDEE